MPSLAPLLPGRPATRHTGTLAVLVTVAALLSVLLASGPSPALARGKAASAKVTISKVTAQGTKVTITGKVTLPASLKNTTKNRKKVKVSLTLKSAAGKSETFAATPTAKLKFTATKTTKLTGRLSLSAQVKVGGKKSGPATTKSKALTIAATGTGTNGVGTSPATPTSTTPISTSPTTTTPTGPAPDGSQTLVGLFKFDAGAQASSGVLSGTYFQMSGVSNGDSTALDKNYTLLRPGTDGGLRTDIYQPPPSPAFAGTIDGQPTGNALANRIVQPQKFFQVDFSIVTDAVDAQTGQADPLPVIFNTDGKLSGQTTAWNAQWSGQSFNQGSPKPDGTSPPGTVPVTGTYNAATRHFVLQWKSLIVGGPFDHFIGTWHLEGTFVPTA